MNQCSARTHSGKQCSRSATVGTLCTQHHKSSAGKHPTEEPWAKLALPPPSEENGARHLQKLRLLLNKGPDKTKDGPGYIYAYYLKTDPKDTFYKIGRTARSVKQRLSEWQEQHGGTKGVVKLKSSWKVPWNKYCEKLIHLYLHYCRVARYPLSSQQGKYKTVLIIDGTIIEDCSDERTVAMRKQHEWFKGSWVDFESLIETLLFKP